MIKLSNDMQLGNLVENQFGDQYMPQVNRSNFDKMDYQSLFNKEFEKTFTQEDTLYVITGTDSGLMVKQLLKTPPKKGSTYLFIDFPEVIALTQSQYDLKEHRRIIVTTEDQWQEEAKKIGMETYFMINRVQRVKSFCAQYYHLNEYLYLRKSIKETIDHLSWQYQSQLGSNIFVQRQLENLTENHTPAILLKDHFKEKSALILAGGPSLDNYIDWVEKNQEHFVVIAVSRIARRLSQTKIKPDIFVSVDPHPSNFYVSQEVYNFYPDSLLVNQFHISPLLLGNWLGVNLYLGDLFPWKTKLNKNNLIGIGPTVTNTAILFAIEMGIKRQILLGVDLCYSPEGFSHATGSIEHDSGPDVNLVGQIVETNKGEQAETNSAYYEAITTIEQLAELSKQSGGQLINPSPNSARMKNINHLLIDDIEIPEELASIADFLQQHLDKNEQSDYKMSHYTQVLNELKNAQSKIHTIEKLSNKGLEYNEKLFSGDSPSDNFNYKLKMDKLENELNHKNLTDLTELSKKFGVNEFLYFLNPDNEQEWTDEDIKKSGETYYKALRTGAVELAKHIFTAINRIEVRMMEEGKIFNQESVFERHLSLLKNSTLKIADDDKLKFNILSKNYDKEKFQLGNEEQRINAINLWMFIIYTAYDGNSARIFNLKKNNKTLYDINEEIILNGKTFAEIKEGFENRYHSFLKIESIENKKDKLEGLETKLYNLFILKDKDRLKKIINGISLLKVEKQDCKDFAHLAQGYLYELEDDLDRAIKEYEQAIGDKTIESSLKRLVDIALHNNDLENAHTGINLLTQISPEYLPQLGDLYKLTKNYKDALDIYTQYLEFNPTDISVMLKVGELYKSQDVMDGAKYIYETIIKADPDNTIAKKNLEQLH